MENRIEITKASLKKDGKIKVSFTEAGPEDQSKVGKEGGAFPHQDLVAAFKGLAPHLAAICDQRDSEGKISDKVSCRSFVLSGEDENAGVLLSGVRRVMGDKVIAMNSPFVFWEKDKNNYAGMKELKEAIMHCKDELYLYLDGKHGVNPQGELFQKEPVTPEPIAETEVKIPATPENVINEMIARAEITPEMKVLVPCARNGEIIKAILQSDPANKVDGFDLLKDSEKVLTKAQLKNVSIPDGEFLSYKPINKYDRVVCQPFPRKDAEYIYHMGDCLAPGGRLIAVVLASIVGGAGKQNDMFRQYLDKVKAIKVTLDNGAFDEAGNAVKTVMIIIDKPEKGKK